MNTKRYLQMFGELAEQDAIPRALYDRLFAEIAAEGKMTKRIYRLYLDELERLRLFDTEGAPFDTEKSAKTDGTYVYKHERNPFWHIFHGFWAFIFKLIGIFGGGIVFGVWRVRGRKNLKALGACITVSNHVGYLDAVLTRRALGFKKQYIVVAPHNCKYTVGGAILRSATELPLPVNIKGARKFNEMLQYVTDKKAAVHFYPEQSMWIDYEKPRPYKDGAFYYAEMLDVPVVPVFYGFKRPRGLRKLLHLPCAAVSIGEPIRIDKELPKRERRYDLAQRAYASSVKLYEEFYGRPLEYLKPSAVPEDTDEAMRETAEISNRNNLKD